MLEALWRKLTTKPIWYYERHRSYPIRQLSKQLPALESFRMPNTLAILSTPDTFDDALWSGWSWLRFLQQQMTLCFFLDGPVSKRQIKVVAKTFPGAGLYSLNDMNDHLQVPGENFQHFVKLYRLGKKVALITHLQEKSSILFCDYDVLAFTCPDELIKASQNNTGPILYNRQPGPGSFDPQLVNRALQLGIALPEGFNSGLMWIPRNSLNYQLANHILAGWSPQTTHGWFSEQTLFAILANHAGCQALPPKRYVVDTQRQFYWQDDVDYQKIAARHFIYPVRHVMYLKGQPIIHEQSRHYPPSGG